MDTIFGSEGVAAEDFARMEAINAEIGLDKLLAENGNVVGDSNEKVVTEKGEHINQTNAAI